MNYLGHAYLSPRDEQLLLGNLAGDSVRRVATETLPRDIQLGLELHERIDIATDAHPAFKRLCASIDQAGIPYPGVIADLLIDYILASRWGEFSDEDFESFKQRVYHALERGAGLVSARFLFTSAVLTSEDWFESYRTIPGMETAFRRLGRRTRRLLPMARLMSFLDSSEPLIRELGAEVLNAVRK